MATPVLCHLCNEPVVLERAKINELGKAVHEDCYVQALQVQKRPVPQSPPSPDSMA